MGLEVGCTPCLEDVVDPAHQPLGRGQGLRACDDAGSLCGRFVPVDTDRGEVLTQVVSEFLETLYHTHMHTHTFYHRHKRLPFKEKLLTWPYYCLVGSLLKVQTDICTQRSMLGAGSAKLQKSDYIYKD